MADFVTGKKAALMATEALPTVAFPRSSAPAATSLFNPLIDVLAVGGLSLIIYLLFMGAGYLAYPLTVATFAMVMNYFINFPHFSATYVRAYGSWETIKTYSGVCIITPLMLCGVAVMAILQPQPWAVWFGKAYLLSVGYHYSGQTYGIALIFAGKAKVMLSRGERYILMAPIYASYFYLLGQKEVSTASPEALVDFEISPLGLPSWLSPASMVVFSLAVGLYVTWNLYRFHRGLAMLPTICHVVVGSQLIWLAWGANNVAYNNLVPLFHCLQYLLITTFFYFRSILSGTDRPTSLVGMFASTSFWRYYLMLIVIGVILFEAMQRLVSGLGLAEMGLATAVVLSFVNLHHFIMDGRIWRLRKQEVRQVIMQPSVSS